MQLITDEELVVDTSHLITEDGAPVGSVYQDKQRILLVDPLHHGWAGPPGAGARS